MSFLSRPLHVFLVFFRLGLTSFGGPVAHIGIFRREFVERRRWLSEREYGDLVALCQFLPGPSSSQVGMAIGLRRAKLPGLVAAWLGFTMPSAVIITLFAWGMTRLGDVSNAGWILGIKAAAVGIVAHALIGMSRGLLDGWRAKITAAMVFLGLIVVPHPAAQIVAIAGTFLVFFVLHRGVSTPASLRDRRVAHPGHREVSTVAALTSLVALVVLLTVPPVLLFTGSFPAGPAHDAISLTDSFVRAGSFVFGGGHVVLPLLEAETVAPGHVDEATFLTGYGVAQIVPGPLFTFAAFLGASMESGLGRPLGAAIALIAMFLPGALLLIGVYPFWERLRVLPRIRVGLVGANSAVVGLLAAALVDPVLTHGVTSWGTAGIAVLTLGLLTYSRIPVWILVPAAGVLGYLPGL